MAIIPALVSDPVRLEILDFYRILDTEAEVGFDDVVMLARKLCDTPIALVSLVADKRQWFKAVSGLDVCETPIEQSVCAHALEQGSTLNIPDLTRDDRTRENTLVTGDPRIRFYAGAILKTPKGVLLGTVCVIDTVPRPDGLTPDQTQSLEALARQVMIQLELRRAKIDTDILLEEQRANELRLRMAQDAGEIGSFEVDIPSDQMTVTEQFCRVYGLPYQRLTRPEAIERLVFAEDEAAISTRARRQHADLPLVVEYRIRKADSGETAWVARRAQILSDADGKPQRMIGTVQDITERKLAEDQLKLLNDELGHRIKNSMTLVQAIASQTLRGTTDRQALNAFNQRIGALSRAHDVMLEQKWSSARMWEVVESALAAHADRSRFKLAGPRVNLEPKATLSLSLLLHELATNAVKYGALSVSAGRIEVTWSKDASNLHLKWQELGGPIVKQPESKGMGSRLIAMGLVGTSNATKTYDPAGFHAEFVAPLEMVEPAASGAR
jgi:PAS domain S-box-containing protein